MKLHVMGVLLLATVLCQQVSNSEADEEDIICTGDCMIFWTSPLLEDIYFEFDQHNLDDNAINTLKENIWTLKDDYPSMRIEVQGHCDERGSNNHNLVLGQRRAHSIKQYMVSQGIDGSRIEILSYGEEKPFCFESNEKCWKENNRGHFVILSK